jgi:hypothetical protein
MKRWVQFYQSDLAGKPVEAIASDSILPLDGRWSLGTCHAIAQSHAFNLLQGIGKRFCGYEIHRGQRLSSPFVLTTYRKLP